MSTFTIRVTSPATNAAGTSFAPATQQPDLGAPSFLDMIVTNSTEPLLPNGVYDAYCLTPLIDIHLSPTTYPGTTNYPGNTVPSFDPSGSLVLTQPQIDRINWLLAQNPTSDPKFGGQFNYGEVQTAIWKILGFTDAQILAAGQTPFLNDGGNNVVNSADIDFLVSQSAAAIASGNGVLPTDAFFTTFIDPTGNVQPLIIQLQSARLGDYVWLDGNGNGLQDLNEPGVDNVVVELYDGSGNFITSTKTGDDFSTAAVEHGFYQFTGLKAGDYQVKFIAPTSYQFTKQDANGNAQDAADSDANVTSGFSQVVTLPPGGSNQTIDAGLVQPASLGDRLWLDSNANGQQDDGATGISGQTVTLIGGGADGLIATAGDNTTATTTTGTDGFYEFTGLTPGVEYQVQFAAPAGTVFTGQNVGNDVSDSDADTTTGKTQIVTLASGEHNPTLDAGVYVPASLGDRLWLDSNANGQQDDGATGISGKTVTLIGGGTDGLINGVGDTTATTTTGTDGFYEFTGLTPGVEYQVQFAAPAGTVFTGQNVGNDASDSDADTTTGKTQIVTLASGEHNPTLDAGVVIPPASLGDRLWLDSNANGQQDDGATGISGQTVTLIGGGADGLIATAGDNTTATTTTGTDGFYEFTGLTPGVEYQVQFAAPAGTVFTGQNVGNDASDSDADTTTGKTQI
ncbi:MAG: SdrD B-like domain-containing protein, partial [Accumulibacter sp.]|uniref:SdrD B-like domain-containing protein n=1 Tax=Accumulibacter sp. TaxID=2053492 RepID=UPI002FC2E66C